MRRIAPIVALAVVAVAAHGTPARAEAHSTTRARRNVDGVLLAAGDPGALVRAEIFCPAPGGECAYGVQALLAIARRQPERLRVTVAITPLMDGDEVARAAVEAARVGHLEDWFRTVAKEPRRALLASMILEVGLDPRRAASAVHDRVLAAAARRAAALGLMTTRAMIVWNGESTSLPGGGQIEDHLAKAERTARLRLDTGVPRERLARTMEDEARRERAPRPLGVEPRPRRRLPPLDQPSQGDPRAPVTIVLFGALDCPQCPFLWSQGVGLAERFPGQVRVVWRHLPTPSPEGRAIATVAACSARRGELPALLDRLANGRRPTVSERSSYAALAGVEPDPACAADVTRDATLAADLGLVAPPALFVNGLELPRTHQLRDQVAIELLPGALADLAEEGRGVLSAPPAR